MSTKGYRRGRKTKESEIGGSLGSNMRISWNHQRSQAKKRRLELTLMMNRMGRHRVISMSNLKNRYHLR